MELQGDRLIPASVDTTWAALNDPAVLKACIAGCESLERTGDDAYTAVVAVKVGPVSARFKGNLKMTDVQPPHAYTINFDGQGGMAGFGKGSADVKLGAEGAAATRLAYLARAQVGGKLAQIGSRLIDAAASKIADDFFKAFEAHLQAQVVPAGAGVPGPAVVSPGGASATSAAAASTGNERARRPSGNDLSGPARPPAVQRPVGAIGYGLIALIVVVTIYFVAR